MMQKRWNILQADPAKVAVLQTELKISPVICRILAQRGIETFGQARDFFRPKITELHNPWLMKDMDKAVSRILAAFQSQETILVYGDYDVDGTTAAACLFQFFQNWYIPALTDFSIPHRYRKGYPTSTQAIYFAKQNHSPILLSLHRS